MRTVQTDSGELVAAEHLFAHEYHVVQEDIDSGRAFDWNTCEYGTVECLHDVWTFIPEDC